MPPVFVLLPAALLVAGALATWPAGRAGWWGARGGAFVGAVLAAAALAAEWALVRSPVELGGFSVAGLGLGGPGGGGFRLDALSFVYAIAVLVPGALLLGFQVRRWEQAGGAALVLAAAYLAAISDGVTGAALWFGAACALLLVQLRTDDARAARAFWPSVVIGLLALTWSGAALEATGGTSTFTAVPVTSANPALMLLMAAGVALASGLVPWWPWTSSAWERPRASAGPLALVVVRPVGFMLLLRLYQVGGGAQPSALLDVALGLLGTGVSLAAAWRAHAATDRRSALGELVPLASGAALLALGAGTPAAIAAATLAVLAGGLLVVMVTLLPARSAAWAAAAVLLAAVPPGLPFVARLLGVQAALEAGDGWAFLALAMAVAWVLGIAATVRAVMLPDPPATAAAEGQGGSPAGALLAGLALAAGGPAAGLVLAAVGLPAAREVTGGPATSLGGGLAAASTVSGAWPAAELGIPLLLLLGAAVAAAGRLGPVPAQRAAAMLELPRLPRLRALAAAAANWRVPAEYRSLLDPPALEAAMARGRPALWAVLVLVLAIVVTR